MSRKSEDQSEPSSKRAKPSTSSSFPEVAALTENATPGFDQDLLRCPICFQFPRKEVYQCNSGHSVCANCLSKLRRCPTCRCLYKKVRNYVVEGLLDSMKFECSWKDFNCQEAAMVRKDLTSHEAQCEFNPNSIEFCKIFEESCNKKFCPVSTQDPVEMNIFLDHVKSEHGFTVQDVDLKESFLINLKYRSPGNLIYLGSIVGKKEQLTRTILRLKSTKTPQGPSCCQVWAILSHFALINLQPALLLKCVRLTDENKDLSISFTLTTAGQEKVGPQVPDLSWTVQPEGIRHLNELLVGKPSDDLSSYHMIPDNFLRNYLTGKRIRITIKCVFTS